MKIVFCQNQYEPRINGLMSSAQAYGIDCIGWNKNIKPAMDMIDEINPDVIFFSILDYDNNVEFALEQCKDIAIVVLGQTIPKHLLSRKNILLCPLKSSDKQQSVFKKMEINFIDIDYGANLAAINRGSDMKKDGYFIYSDFNFNSRVLEDAANKNIIIAGPNQLRLIEYVGDISNKEHADFIKTYTNIVLNKEELYNVLACGGDGFAMFENNMLPIINGKRPMELEKARKITLEKHTYFNRLEQILIRLGIPFNKNTRKQLIEKLS